MNKKIMQFRYYGTKNKNNFPANIKAVDISTEDFFKNYYPIHYIKIQGPNSIKFQINSNLNSVMLGPSGIYELDLEGIGRIHTIRFDANSLKQLISDTENYLIIDIIYDGG